MWRTGRMMVVVGALVAMSASMHMVGRASAEAVTEPSMKGFGIKAVEGGTLAAMLDRCAQAAQGPVPLASGETPQVLHARCEQLQRSLRTQPGNTQKRR